MFENRFATNLLNFFFNPETSLDFFFFESERYHQQKCISNLPQFGLDGGNNFAKGCLQFLPFIFKNQSSNLQLFAFFFIWNSLSVLTSINVLKKIFYVKPNFLKGQSVEISEFFYHSYFTWNQSWWFLGSKNCHSNTIGGSEFRFLLIFALLEDWNWPNKQNSEALKW